MRSYWFNCNGGLSSQSAGIYASCWCPLINLQLLNVSQPSAQKDLTLWNRTEEEKLPISLAKKRILLISCRETGSHFKPGGLIHKLAHREAQDPALLIPPPPPCFFCFCYSYNEECNWQSDLGAFIVIKEHSKHFKMEGTTRTPSDKNPIFLSGAFHK